MSTASKLKLTDDVCARARWDGQDRVVWDILVPGLGLALGRESKSWLVYARLGTGRGAPQKKLRFGRHPDLPVSKAREQARLKLAEWEAEIAAAKADKPKEMTVQGAVDMWRKSRKYNEKMADKSRREYDGALNRHVLPRWADKPLSQVDGEMLAELHDDISERAPMAANRTIAYLRSVWNWGAKKGAWSNNPGFARVEFNEESTSTQFFRPEQARELVAVLDSWPDKEAALLFHFLLVTGCRISEARSLHWVDDGRCNFLDLGGRQAVLRTHKTVRKAGTRYVSLNSDALDVVKRMADLQDPEGRLWPLSYEDYHDEWSRIREAAKCPKHRIHSLRHTFATLSLMGSADLRAVADQMGHLSLQTTMRYAKSVAEARNRAADSLSAVLKGA
jgi:integrase